METKHQDDFIRDKLQDLQYPHFFSVPPIGAAGGLALLWSDNIKMEILESSPNIIDAKVSFKGTSSFISFIYGSPIVENRAATWEKVSRIGANREQPWLLTGDFNDILDNSEKVGGPERWEGSFTNFRTFVSHNGLWDLKHSGNHLSWRGTRFTHFIRSKLDRAMANCSWAERFRMGRCSYLRFEGSDHRPLVTYFNSTGPKKRGLFRFNRSLTDNEEITSLVDASWNSSPLASVIAKLNACRRNIIQWTKDRNEKANQLISETRVALDAALSSSLPDVPRIEALLKTLTTAYKDEEQFWLQRSRIQWLKKGDRNTGFFHAATRTRRMQNAFSVIEDSQGAEFFEDQEIARVIAAYYQDIFATKSASDFSTIQELLPRKVTEEMNDHLTRLPTTQEIKEATFSINPGKAPGPDGFSSKFYQAYWHIIGEDVSREVLSFFETGTLDPRQNETHIRLIPKGTSPRTVADYRPIALCNTHYKIIAKILTRRLKPLLPELISKNQSAFVSGRAIGDNVLITHETLHFLRTSEAKKYCSMAVKTDMSKAYDRIECNFLNMVLSKMGFAPVWISWIMACVESVSYSFLINGTPQGTVTPSRGIRQGDPLSPYLFILCTEVLSALCSDAQDRGTLQGIRVARGCPQVNHLLFADDTMFFCRSGATAVSKLKQILDTYEAVSGQLVKLPKVICDFLGADTSGGENPS